MADIVLAISLFYLVVCIFLVITYKKKFLCTFYNSGVPGIFGGIILSTRVLWYTFLLCIILLLLILIHHIASNLIFSYIWFFFLKEKINLITLISNYSSNVWCAVNGWKFIISRRIIWKFSSFSQCQLPLQF